MVIDDFPTRDEIEQGLLENVIKAFCPECGKEVVQNKHGRPKKFCCNECRQKWKNRHYCPPLRKTAVVMKCPVCGKEFLSDRMNSRPRKYCSISCSNRGRRMLKNASKNDSKAG